MAYENQNYPKINLVPSLPGALLTKFGGNPDLFQIWSGGLNLNYLYVSVPDVSDYDLANFLDNEFGTTASAVTIESYFINGNAIYMSGNDNGNISYRRLTVTDPDTINPNELSDLWTVASEVSKADFIGAYESNLRPFYFNIFEQMTSAGGTDIDTVIALGNTAYGQYPPKMTELEAWLHLLELDTEITPDDDIVETLNRLRKVNIVLGMLLLPSIGLLAGGST